MQFSGPATKLIDTDLPRFGSLIGVGEDEVHAVLDVETSGSGFDSQKRPRMLFEPHKFYAHVSGTKRSDAIAAGVAYLTQGTRPYPSDSYPHLAVAISIDEEAALKSASWGLGQVLGENFVHAGYTDVYDFVDAMIQSESNQLGAMISFIKNAHLDDELRAHNWAAFARGYNGSGYAKNAYDKKLAAAFVKWQKIRDTPYPASLAQTMNAALRTTVQPNPAPIPIPVIPFPSVPVQPQPSVWSTIGSAIKHAFFKRNDQ